MRSLVVVLLSLLWSFSAFAPISVVYFAGTGSWSSGEIEGDARFYYFLKNKEFFVFVIEYEDERERISATMKETKPNELVILDAEEQKIGEGSCTREDSITCQIEFTDGTRQIEMTKVFLNKRHKSTLAVSGSLEAEDGSILYWESNKMGLDIEKMKKCTAQPDLDICQI